MKTLFLVPCCVLFFTSAVCANPEIQTAVSQAFGNQVAESIVLVKGTGITADPTEWTAYARDAFRPDSILRMVVSSEAGLWKASAAGAGERVLDRVPPRSLDLKRLRYRSNDARTIAGKAAVLAHATFVSVDFQLAAQADTGAPEWALALKDETGYEVGFLVISAETGAVTFQDWTPQFASTNSRAESEGERAAEAVKRTARKAWNWSDNARKETKNFFRELFR